jgi:hypothetical protein
MNINGEPTRNDKTLNGESSLGEATADDLVVEGDLTVKGTSSLEGVLDMNNAKIINVGTPTNPADATNKQYVDGVIPDTSVFFKKDGSVAATGDFDLGSNKITGLANGTASSDAAAFGQIPAAPDLTPYFKKDGSVAATGDFDLNSNKITGLANGTASSDAAAFGQIPAAPDLTPYFKKDGSVAATGDFDLNSNKITGLANGTASSDAAAFGQIPAAPDLSPYFKKDGSVAATGDFDLNSNKITGLANGTASSDAAAFGQIPAAPDLTPYFKKDGSVAATGDFDLNSNKITGLANGTASSDAAAFGQIPAAPDLSPYFKKDGSVAATGDFDLNSNKITGLANGTASSDAAAFGQIPAAPDLTPYFKKDGSVAATGDFDLNSNKITGLANGTASSDAAAFGQIPAAPDLTPYFKKDGSVAATGDFDLNSNKITNVTDPSSNQDAATKKYVDDNAGSLWTELSGNIYYDVGGVGIGLSAPAYALEVKGSMRVAEGESIDAGFLAESTTGNIRTFNNSSLTGDTNAAIVCRQMTDFSAGKYTELEIQQIYRNTSQNNSAVWGINVASESGSFTGNQTNSSILCLMKDNGSVVINSSRNNNGFRLRVHGSSAGSSANWSYSDDRIKYHEQDIKGALGILNKLKAQKYEKITESLNETGKWIPSNEDWDTVKNSVNDKGQRLYEYIEEIGFIAQEVRKIPDLSFSVTGEEVDEEGDQTPLLLQYQDIFCLAIQGIQELDTKRKEDNKRILDLNKRLLVLEDKLKNVESKTEKEYIL